MKKTSKTYKGAGGFGSMIGTYVNLTMTRYEALEIIVDFLSKDKECLSFVVSTGYFRTPFDSYTNIQIASLLEDWNLLPEVAGHERVTVKVTGRAKALPMQRGIDP